MSLEDAVFLALKGLVGNRVYPLTFPQQSGTAPVWPAIRYTVISAVPILDICGDDDEPTDEVRMQIDVVALTYSEVQQLKRSVRDVMATFVPPATLENVIEDFDADTRTRRCVMDFVFHGSSATGNSPP